VLCFSKSRINENGGNTPCALISQNFLNSKVVFYWDQPFLVRWVDGFLVGLVDQPFQPASNRVEMVEKEFARLCCVIVAHITTIPRGYRVSTKNGWKCSTEKGQPVAVETVDPNRTRANFRESAVKEEKLNLF